MSAETLILVVAASIFLFGCWALWYALGSKGAVKARRFVGALGCLAICTLVAGIYGAFYRVFRSSYEAAKNTACMANMNQIGKAFLMYAGDNDERMPGSGWTEAIVGYVGDRLTYSCPMLDAPYGYSMNRRVTGLDTRTVNTNLTVAAFDGPGGKDHLGEPLSVSFRHNSKYATIGFLDGHCRRFLKADLPSFAPPLRKP